MLFLGIGRLVQRDIARLGLHCDYNILHPEQLDKTEVPKSMVSAYMQLEKHGKPATVKIRGISVSEPVRTLHLGRLTATRRKRR